jgi:TonB family protein
MGTRLLCIAVYVSTFAGLAAGQVVQLTPERSRHEPAVISPERAAELEAQLARDPDNERLHAELLVAYFALSQPSDPVAGAKFNAQVLWFVANHPESPVLDKEGLGQPFGMRDANDQTYQEIESLWVNQLVKFPESAPVLFHAGLFFRRFEGGRALDLFKKASRLEPENPLYRSRVIDTYALAEESPGSPSSDGKTIGYGNLSYEVTESLRQELATSTDPELLSGVGFHLAHLAFVPGFDNDAVIIVGQQLMERAVAIDPANPRWSRALDEARKPRPPRPPSLPGAIADGEVGANADQMEKRLTNKVDPVYPPAAKEARVEGNVVFTLRVGRDGSVQRADLVWGEPLLVNAAREAVLQYRYKPIVYNGAAIPVAVMIKIEFKLPADPPPGPK